MNAFDGLKRALREEADPAKAVFYPRYFKAGPGEYAEGDQFLGVTVPKQRRIAKTYYKSLSLEEVEQLICSSWHEERLTALFILVLQFEKANKENRQALADFYLANTTKINNWDLVDSSAPKILGEWLVDKDRSVLLRLAKSNNLWEKRIAIIATLAFIARGDFTDTIVIAEILLNDSHDLIHKAVGWMLREVGNRDGQTLRDFLNIRASQMPRTMLRYAIEKLPVQERRLYLSK